MKFSSLSEFTRRHRKLSIATFVLLAVVVFLYLFIPGVWQLKNGSVKVTQWDKKVGKRVVEVGPKSENWTNIDRVSKHVLHAIIVAEDGRFYEHSGVDFHEIYQSLLTNLKKKRYARGGATITQQVVKVSFLSLHKSLWRKLREVVGAVLLEHILTKNQILEWYINLVEFGDGVYGIKRAAWHYFHTKPELITIDQAAHLALVLPSPNGWSVGLRRRDLTEFGHKRFAQIVHRMKLRGYITEAQWLATLATGNFGRPLSIYEDILVKYNQDKAAFDLTAEEELDVAEDPVDDDDDAVNIIESGKKILGIDESKVDVTEPKPENIESEKGSNIPTEPAESETEYSEDQEKDEINDG